MNTRSIEAEFMQGYEGLVAGDVLNLLQLFGAMDPSVGYDNSGLLNFVDVLEFLQFFQVGC